MEEELKTSIHQIMIVKQQAKTSYSKDILQ